MVLHGTLHLMGFDHETGRDAKAMERRERELLAGLGFDDPYSV
jgi:probable rRNA maturation factor